MCSENSRCMGVEYFKQSGKSNVSGAYKPGDCLLNSGSDINRPKCDADYYQMYFWKQGRFVECSADKPESTKAKSSTYGDNKVNKNSRSYNNNRYSYNGNTKSMK